MRDSLKQADAEDLDLSWTYGPKPASKRTSVDFVSEANEVWKRHRVSRVTRNVCVGNRVPTSTDYLATFEGVAVRIRSVLAVEHHPRAVCELTVVVLALA